MAHRAVGVEKHPAVGQDRLYQSGGRTAQVDQIDVGVHGPRESLLEAADVGELREPVLAGHDGDVDIAKSLATRSRTEEVGPYE
jgi:hypothetical protein